MGRGQPNVPGPTSTGQGSITAAQDVIVSTKEVWTGAWEVQPLLQPIRSTFGLSPHINQASFRYVFGKTKLEEADDFATLDTLGLQNHYVKIEVFTTHAPREAVTTWIGQLVQDGRTPAGVEPTSGTGSTPNPPTGGQVFTAFGLEHLLKKATIDRTYAANGNAEVITIDRSISFNRRRTRGGPLEGNAATINPPTLDVFGLEILNFARFGILWSHDELINYLLHYFVNERFAPKFVLMEQVFSLLGGPNHETIENFFGMTVFDALNKLIDRRRGLTWFVQVADTDQSPIPVQIIVQSTLEEPITLADVNIPANPNRITYDFDPSIRVQKLAVTKSSANQYRYIQVRGALVRSMTTLNYEDGSLVEGWTQDEENLYKLAASETDGYGALTEAEKAVRNDTYRRENPLVSHVYRRFVVPADFDWRAGDGLGGPNHRHQFCILPTIKADLGIVEFGKLFPDKSADFLNGQKGFMRELFLLKRTDYALPNHPSETPSTESAEYLEPFVFVRHRVGDDGPIPYHIAHKMGAQSGNNLPTAGLRMLNGEPGFELILSGSTPNHAWALNTWPGPINDGDVEALPSEFQPNRGNAVDYKQMSATVAIETDQRMRVRVDVGAVGDNDSELAIDLPNLHHWSMTRLTRWQATDDHRDMQTVQRSYIPIRDDTPQLRRIAAFAKAWYGRERRSIDVTQAPPMAALELGALVLALVTAQGQIQTNTVVSLIEHDYLEQTVRNTTDFVDLDIRAMLGGGGGVSSDTGTPSLPPTRRVVKDHVDRIDRIEEQLNNLPVHSPENPSGITDWHIGKIVSWHKDLVCVARMEHGDPNEWDTRTFTDEDDPSSNDVLQCVWSGVGSVKRVGLPVECYKPANSSRYVARIIYNTVGDWDDAGGNNGEFQACEPDAADVVDPGDSCDGPVSSDDQAAAVCNNKG